MTGGWEGPTGLNFKGSGCDHEVLGVLEAKTSKTRPYLISKCLFLKGFWPLEPQKPHGRRTLEIELCGFHLAPSHPWALWVRSASEDIKDFFSFSWFHKGRKVGIPSGI